MSIELDIERFERIDEVRRVCEQQGIVCNGDSWTRENLAWIFELAKTCLLVRAKLEDWKPLK